MSTIATTFVNGQSYDNGMSEKEQAAFDAWYRKQKWQNKNPEAAWAAGLKWAANECHRRWSKEFDRSATEHLQDFLNTHRGAA